jgi:hypothetical protein
LNVLPRRVYAATYGDSDPPAVAALLAAVTAAARAA